MHAVTGRLDRKHPRTRLNVDRVQRKRELLSILLHEQLQARERAVLWVDTELNQRAEITVTLGKIISVANFASRN